MSLYYGNLTFMLSLPRSRSAWMCEFLRPIADVMHDPLKNCAAIDELGVKIDNALTTRELVFVADTAGAFFYDQIRARFPGARYLVVDRDVDKVMASFRAKGVPLFGANEDMLHQEDLLLSQAAGVLRANHDYVCVVDYNAINAYLRNIWRFVGGLEQLTDQYINVMMRRNVQIPFHKQLRQTDNQKVAKLFASRTALP